jgi:copper chaperone NosL
MRRTIGVAGLIVAGMLGGCQRVQDGRPPKVRYGEEACAFCRMIISDERFTAALRTETGDVLKFDDIGCLIQHEPDQLRPGVTYWVRDWSGPGWLKARDATFIHCASVVSPMGHGLAAIPRGRSSGALVSGPTSRTLQFNELPGFLADSRRAGAADPPTPK